MLLSVRDALEYSPLEAAIAQASTSALGEWIGGYSLSRGWFFRKKVLGGYDAFRAIDVCWAYVTKEDATAFDPHHGGRWKTVVRVRPDRKVEIQNTPQGEGEHHPVKGPGSMMGALRGLVPWALFGYSERRYECWKKDRDTFLKLVEERLEGVRGALRSGRLVVDRVGNLVTEGKVDLPTLTFVLLRKGNGKVAGRRYNSSSIAPPQPGAAIYQA